MWAIRRASTVVAVASLALGLLSPGATEARTRAPAMTLTQALRNACGEGAIQIAGPWLHEGATYHAAVVWREGATTACLAMVRKKNRGVRIVARGQIAAGSSARYGESYAPALRAEPLLLGGLPPLVVTDTTEMGLAGGGGSETAVWVARGGRWASAYAEVLDGVTDIDASVDRGCPSPAPVALITGDDGRPTLRVERCFDGAVETALRRFDGQRFR